MKIEKILKATAHIPSSVHELEQRMWHRFLKGLSSKLVIVDFGTGWAKSACSLGLICPKATVYTFDHGLPHINKFRSKEQYIQEVKDYIAKSGAENVNFTFGSSLEVPWSKKIDILNIDSDESYEHAKKEIKRWLPFVKKGGLVFFHDYTHPKCHGVRQAIDELIPKKFPMKLLKAVQAGAVKCACFRKE